MTPDVVTVLAQDYCGEPVASRGVLRVIGEAFLEHRLAVVGLALIAFMLLFSFIGPLFYHTVQNRPNLNTETLPPSAAHILGTDDQGYDELGRLMLGGQSSLEVGCAAALLATVWGTAWGAIAGYLGGWIDSIMMRIVDSVMAIPYLLLIMLLTTIFRPTVPVLILIIGGISWLGTARLVRGDTLSVRMRDYVQASKGVGLRSERIILRHIVPNVIGTVAVAATFSVADSILLLASLSFLGLGPPPPAANWAHC